MSNSEGIPIRRFVVPDTKDMPINYGETPGGSIYSTTPGGTRIFYDRAFLLSRRESPMTRSPPFNLPYIPEITLIPEPSKNVRVVENGVKIAKKEASESMINKSNINVSEKQSTTLVKKAVDDLFSMDM